MTKAERGFVIMYISSSSGVLFGLTAGFMRMGQLSKEVNLSLASKDPIEWLCIVAIGLGIYLSTRIKSTDEKIDKNKLDDGILERHVVEKHNFEITPLGINMGKSVVDQTKKPKNGTAEEVEPDPMDQVLNQAMYGTAIPITHFSKPKKK